MALQAPDPVFIAHCKKNKDGKGKNMEMPGALLGKGNTADVFDIGDNKALKLFHTGYPQSGAVKEYENSQLLNQLDIPIAKSEKMVNINGRYGIVYNKICGKSLLDMVLETADIQKYASLMAALHKKLLCRNLPRAASFQSVLLGNIENAGVLSARGKSTLCAILRALPDCDGLCHGDFHFGNILIERQQATIIDFMNVCKGHKNFDIARTVYLTEMTPVPENMPDKGRMLAFKKQAADVYLETMGVTREDLSDWILVVAAARLSELGSANAAERQAVLQYLSQHGI